MTSKLISRRLLETAGLFLIGDGLMGILRPRRHSLLWHFGPELGRAVSEELASNPKVARSVYLAEVALGIVLSVSQTDDLF
jgi:hypothetical protein